MRSSLYLIVRNIHVVAFYYAIAGLIDLLALLFLALLGYLHMWTLFMGMLSMGLVFIYLPVPASDKLKKAFYTFFDDWLNDHRIYWPDESDYVSADMDDDAFGTWDGLSSAKRNKFLFTYHPHGVIALAAMVHGSTHPIFLSRKMVPLAHSNLFLLPITSICVRLLGAKSSRADSMKKLMERGERYLALVPGGGDEMLFTNPHVDEFFLKNRKGFIKYALHYGYAVVPVYTVDETELYSVLRLPRGSNRVRRVSINIFLMFHAIFIHGWLWFTFLPKRKALRSYIGSALEFPHIPDPTRKDVEKYHSQFLSALLNLRSKPPNQHKKCIIR